MWQFWVWGFVKDSLLQISQRFSVGRRNSKVEKYNYLFKLTNIFFFTIGLQTELDFRSLLLIPTLPWRQNLFHSCTLKETSCSFFFFKSNTNATCANCPTSFLSFHYLFLMALKLKTTELNGWEFSLGDRLPELTPWPGNNRQGPSPPSFLITVKL